MDLGELLGHGLRQGLPGPRQLRAPHHPGADGFPLQAAHEKGLAALEVGEIVEGLRDLDPVGPGHLEEAELLRQGQGLAVDHPAPRPAEKQGVQGLSGAVVHRPGLLGGPPGEAP